MKYRVIVKFNISGEANYIVQSRSVFFWWTNINEFKTLPEAKCCYYWHAHNLDIKTLSYDQTAKA